MGNRDFVTELECEINILRILMISTAKLKGFNHPETIKCSQELDMLLNKHHQINSLEK